MNKKGLLINLLPIIIVIILVTISIILIYYAFKGTDVQCSTGPTTQNFYDLIYLCGGILLLMIAVAYSSIVFRPRKEEKNAKDKHKLSDKE